MFNFLKNLKINHLEKYSSDSFVNIKWPPRKNEARKALTQTLALGIGFVYAIVSSLHKH